LQSRGVQKKKAFQKNPKKNAQADGRTRGSLRTGERVLDVAALKGKAKKIRRSTQQNRKLTEWETAVKLT